MVRGTLCAAVLLVLCGAGARAQELKALVDAGYCSQDSENLSRSKLFARGRYAFKTFDADIEPYAEALWLSRTPTLGAGVVHTSFSDAIDGDELQASAPMRYADPDIDYTGALVLGWRVRDVEFSGGGEEEITAWTWGLGAGYFLGPQFELNILVLNERWDRDGTVDDNGTDQQVILHAKGIGNPFGEHDVNGEFILRHHNSELVGSTASRLDVTMIGDIYLSRHLGLGLQTEISAGDFDREGLEVGLRFSYFPAPSYGVRLFGAQYWDNNSDNNDELVLCASIQGRF